MVVGVLLVIFTKEEGAPLGEGGAFVVPFEAGDEADPSDCPVCIVCGRWQTRQKPGLNTCSSYLLQATDGALKYCYSQTTARKNCKKCKSVTNQEDLA